jgi:hypothetical protein
MQLEPIHHGSRLACVVATVAALAPACASQASGGQVSFHRDIQPIFTASCAGCHPSAYPYLDLQPGAAYKQLVRVSPPNAPSYERVVPGRPQLSYLLIHPLDPSRKNLLTAGQKRLITRWIVQGAKNN